VYGRLEALRQRLREWLYDSADKAGRGRTQVEVSACFVGLLGWMLSWWQGHELALTIDATLHGDRVVALVVSPPRSSPPPEVHPSGRRTSSSRQLVEFAMSERVPAYQFDQTMSW
jgi:hypothetical protein